MKNCPRCGSDELELVNWMTHDDFDLVRCSDCGFTWEERPEEEENNLETERAI